MRYDCSKRTAVALKHISPDQKKELVATGKGATSIAVAIEIPRRGQAPGALSHMVAANLRARALAPVVREIYAAGFMTYNAVSRELNRRKVTPLRAGKQWYPMTAARLLVRLKRAGYLVFEHQPLA